MTGGQGKAPEPRLDASVLFSGGAKPFIGDATRRGFAAAYAAASGGEMWSDESESVGVGRACVEASCTREHVDGLRQAWGHIEGEYGRLGQDETTQCSNR